MAVFITSLGLAGEHEASIVVNFKVRRLVVQVNPFYVGSLP